jgi:hypothetical protein
MKKMPLEIEGCASCPFASPFQNRLSCTLLRRWVIIGIGIKIDKSCPLEEAEDAKDADS